MAETSTPRGGPRLALKPLLRSSEDVLGLVHRIGLQRKVAFDGMARRIGFTHPFEEVPTQAQVGRLEHLLRAEPGSLSDWALCAEGRGKARYRCEAIPRLGFLRRSGHLCPVCVTEDRASDELEGDRELRPWLRSHWALDFFSACERHAVRLVSSCHCGEPFGSGLRALDRCARGHRAEFMPLASVSEEEVAATRYLHDRLARPGADIGRGVPVLDRMAWPHAFRTMLRIGLFKLHGRDPPELTSGMPPDGAGAIARGFDELREFPASFEQLLDELSKGERRPGGPAGIYGQRLYSFIVQQGANHLEPFRLVFERHAGRSSSGGGTSSFGKAQEVREEELSAAELARLRQHLRIPADARPTKREATRLGRAADVIVQSKGLCEMLGTRHIGKLLIQAGAVNPAWDDREVTLQWFYRVEVSELLFRLKAGAVPVASLPDDAVRLDNIHHHKIPVITVIEALLAGRLQASRLERVEGLAAFFFSREQSKLIWAVCAPADSVDLKLVRHEQKIAQNLMLMVVRNKLLEPRRSSARYVVGASDVERFARKYVSGSKLADETSCTSKLLQNRLKAWGVEPLLTSNDGQLFLREDVEAHRQALVAAGKARRHKTGDPKIGLPKPWKPRLGVLASG